MAYYSYIDAPQAGKLKKANNTTAAAYLRFWKYTIESRIAAYHFAATPLRRKAVANNLDIALLDRLLVQKNATSGKLKISIDGTPYRY